jgi:cytochrome P450
MDDKPLYYDPFDPACREGLFETYARLHKEAPVYQAATGWWIVSTMDDVHTIHTSPHLFSNRNNGSETLIPAVDPDNADLAERLRPVFDKMLLDTQELLRANVIVGADPPVHTTHRNCVNRAFTRGRVEALRGFVESVVASCLEEIDTAETFDVSDDLACIIPLRVMERLFDLPEVDSNNFKRWAYALAAQLDAEVTRGSVEFYGRHFDLLKEFSDYFVPIFNERKKNPGNDLISDIMSGGDDIITVSEAVLFVLTLLSAGVETTANLIGNVIISLMRHPDQLQMVIDDPSLVNAAVEESLRYDSPFQFSFREAAQDVVLSGVTIPKGGQIILLIGAANHDAKHFPNPDSYDLTRASAGHVGFGHGIHFCLGVSLARMEAQIAVREIVAHLPDFTLDENGIVEVNSLLMWGRRKIPLVRRQPAEFSNAGSKESVAVS